MNNLADLKPSVIEQMNELESRQEALRAELREIQTKLEMLRQTEILKEAATAKLQEIERRIAAEKPEALESFYRNILAALTLEENSHWQKKSDLAGAAFEAIDPEQSLIMPAPSWNANGLTPPLSCDINPTKEWNEQTTAPAPQNKLAEEKLPLKIAESVPSHL